MRIDELDYELPAGAIAVRPAEPRDHSRLMVYHRSTGVVEHRRFFEVTEYLRAGDLLVVNNSKVLPARLLLRKETGALIPGLFLRELALGTWEVMLRSRGKLRLGMTLATVGGPEESGGGGATFGLAQRGGEQGHWIVEVTPRLPAREMLGRIGHVPLPPYIERARERGQVEASSLVARGGPVVEEASDRIWYQTVYADETRTGSLAAPTAGLHFTDDLLRRIQAMGVQRAEVTLHVGLGTFLPVEAATLEGHRMHVEAYSVSADAVRAIREVRKRAAGDEQGRVVVVGTTAVRTLETAAARISDSGSPPTALDGETALMIQPGYTFELTDVLVTNFHLPRSTLMALVGAMVGIEKLKALYRVAIAEGYRFYSYGDAMMIL